MCEIYTALVCVCVCACMYACACKHACVRACLSEPRQARGTPLAVCFGSVCQAITMALEGQVIRVSLDVFVCLNWERSLDE